MSPILLKVMEVYAAPTALRKARAMTDVLDALEVAIGIPKNGLLKATGVTSEIRTMRTEIERLGARVDDLQARDRRAASRGQATQPFLIRNRP